MKNGGQWVPSRGLRYMAMGAFWFSVMSVLVKEAGERLPSMQIVLARAVVTLVLSYALLRHAGLPAWGKARNRRLLVLRGLFGFGGLACFYYAIVHLPLAEATTIQYTNPVFTALLAAWLLREQIGLPQAVAVLASLAGVLLIARPAALFGGAAAGLDMLAMGVALAGAVFSAAAYVTVRRLGAGEHALVIVFYFPLVATPATLPFVAHSAVWPTATEWLLLAGIGIVTQIAQVYLTRGLQLEPAGRATAVGYLQIVFASVWGMLFFAEFPDALALVGVVLIVGGTLSLAWGRSSAP